MKSKLNKIIVIIIFLVLCFFINFNSYIRYVYDLNKIDRYFEHDIDIKYNYQSSYLNIYMSDMEKYKKQIGKIVELTNDFLKNRKASNNNLKFELIFYTSPDKRLTIIYKKKIQITDIFALQDYPKITEIPELYSAQKITLKLSGDHIYTDNDMNKMKCFKNAKKISILKQKNSKKINNLIKILKQNIPKDCKVDTSYAW